jgi:hypothetical protein
MMPILCLSVLFCFFNADKTQEGATIAGGTIQLALDELLLNQWSWLSCEP